jgi:ribonuclease III
MNNIFISKEEVSDILNKVKNIGDNDTRLIINSLDSHRTSFIHKSYLLENPQFHESNERLEFLGDSFLGSITATYLIERFPLQQEGFLTKIRTRIVRSSMLYRFARFLGLGKYILLSNQVERLTSAGQNKGRNNPRLYEDTFEAFVGAIIQDFGDDCGYRYAKRFVISIIEHIIDFSELILCNENYKDTLQRYFQSKKWPNPIYVDLCDSGPSHLKSFVKGIFLKQEYYNELAKTETILIESFLKEQSKFKELHSAIQVYSLKNDSILIGLAQATKKSVAEQNASNRAITNLGIDPHF